MRLPLTYHHDGGNDHYHDADGAVLSKEIGKQLYVASQRLSAYLDGAEDKIQSALEICTDNDISGFNDLRLLLAEIRDLKERLTHQR